MEALAYILNGFVISLTPINVFLLFIGVFIGTVVGVLPGIGPSAGIALLLPVTFGMNPVSALIMLAGIYYGAMYGGSTTSILINTPGESSSVMTTLDGYQMAKKGRAGAALAIAAVGSFIAGTIGIVGLSLLALPLSRFALRFGPAEYFSLFLFAMTAVTALTGKSLAKGMISMFLGLMISTIGIDLQSAQSRYTLGISELQDGIPYLVIVMGLFALSEVFENVEDAMKGALAPIRIKGRLWFTRKEWRRSILPIFRGGVTGFFLGVLPGAGATISSILSYVLEKKCSKHPEEFGKGAIEGVAGPESANNSSTAGAMVPLLTLGVPGSGTTAVMLGAFIMYGVQPGPLLFQNNPDLAWGLIASMYLGNVMLLILNLPLVGIFVRLLYIPVGIRIPAIIGIASIGVYSVSGSVLDLYMLLLFGVLGYAFRKLEIPAVPLVMARVLGGMMEQSFRQAMSISDGDPSILVHSFISVTLLVLAVLMVVIPPLLTYRKKRKKLLM